MVQQSVSGERPSGFARRRRLLLRYLIGGGAGAIALGLLRPAPAASEDADLENLCSIFPNNSRCDDYLQGEQALDLEGNPLVVDVLLPTLTPGEPLPVTGLSDDPELTYLVIEEGPEIAPYGIHPVCTHLGCTVPWDAEQNRFICPCHNSQYDAAGRVLQGPAQQPLPLVTVAVKQNQIRLIDRAPSVDPR